MIYTQIHIYQIWQMLKIAESRWWIDSAYFLIFQLFWILEIFNNKKFWEHPAWNWSHLLNPFVEQLRMHYFFPLFFSSFTKKILLHIGYILLHKNLLDNHFLWHQSVMISNDYQVVFNLQISFVELILQSQTALLSLEFS